MTPITPTPGPPNLEGVPDEAYFAGEFYCRYRSHSWGMVQVGDIESWKIEEWVWHVGPILPPTGKDGEA